jgi:hypothetical protein
LFFVEGKLKRIDVAGGRPLIVADAPAGRGGTWNTTVRFCFRLA